jgi:selenide,water dikinase
VLRQIPVLKNQNLLVGLDTSDDAAVYRVSDEMALISTVDFFTPVVDDPYTFGQIAACNALSDIYAMGGKPILALNVVAFPEDLVEDILPGVLKGGADKIKEAGAVVGGGHSIKNPEPVYGLSVLGQVHPDRVITNAGAKPGDVLILTKSLGTGVATTALKAGMLDEKTEKLVVKIMSTLNKAASEAATEIGVHAVTDITGFGLMGHAYEMAEASNVTIKINSRAIPVIPGVEELAAMGLLPAGLYHNRRYLEGKIKVCDGIPEVVSDLVFDPQTSGGLLISLKKEKAEALANLLESKGVVGAAVIGEVVDPSEFRIVLEN